MPDAQGAASLLRMQQPSAAGCWLPCAQRGAKKIPWLGAQGAPGSLKSMPIGASILPVLASSSITAREHRRASSRCLGK